MLWAECFAKTFEVRWYPRL